MNNLVFKHGFRFILLVLLQVTIFNYVDFLGYINPMIYILFIILFPLRNNRMVFLIVAFFLGLSVDMFSDTGGIHAGASVLLAYIRPTITKFSFGSLNEFYNVKFNAIDFAKRFTYIIIMVIIHHFVVYSLDFFNFFQILNILKYTLFSGIFSVFLILIMTITFSSKK